MECLHKGRDAQQPQCSGSIRWRYYRNCGGEQRYPRNRIGGQAHSQYRCILLRAARLLWDNPPRTFSPLKGFQRSPLRSKIGWKRVRDPYSQRSNSVRREIHRKTPGLLWYSWNHAPNPRRRKREPREDAQTRGHRLHGRGQGWKRWDPRSDILQP